jgi:hypothetical protein
MIVVRDIFQLKFGKAKEAVELWKQGSAVLEKGGLKPMRILTDAVGPNYYTLVLESEYKNLAEYEAAEDKLKGIYDQWRSWYDKFIPLTETGRREILRVVK